MVTNYSVAQDRSRVEGGSAGWGWGGYETFGRQLLCVRNSTAQQMQHEIDTTLMTDEASRRQRSYRNHGQKNKKGGGGEWGRR